MMETARSDATPYADLTPDLVLSAVESRGFVCTGALLSLNSYENRVYQVGIDERRPLVAKFYRPQRWSDAAILEEHAFTLELAAQEIPVVPPLVDEQGRTLHEFQGYRFALFPSQGGRWPELDHQDNLTWLGRFIGRIHAVGAVKPFVSRPALDAQSFGVESYQFLLERGFIPAHLAPQYRDLAESLLKQIDWAYDRATPVRLIRVHGDCHPGNILWTDQGPHFVDLDDCRMAPAIQDIWMMLSGTRNDMMRQLAVFMDGYMDFHEFDPRELNLVEALRTLRMIHYAAWLARRWDDPAFPHSFPWFNTTQYWEQHIGSLREQGMLMDEPSLPFYG